MLYVHLIGPFKLTFFIVHILLLYFITHFQPYIYILFIYILLMADAFIQSDLQVMDNTQDWVQWETSG